MVEMKMIKSPLRYPGGKSKALGTLIPLIPSFGELREPFFGGGSVLLALRQLHPAANYWANDLNIDLFAFWRALRDDADLLVDRVQAIYDEAKKTKSGSKLHQELVADSPRSIIDRATRFFVLNRITFSGTVEAGGFSKGAFAKRFTQSSIDRLIPVAPLLESIKITNDDYEECLFARGEGVVIFLDPPYFSATKSRLYGKKGILHTGFDHDRFAANMKKTKHQWIITYDDSPEIRDLFAFANIHEWTMQYGMNNYKQKSAAAGKELIISNFRLPGSV